MQGLGAIDSHIRRLVRAIVVRQRKRQRFLYLHLKAKASAPRLPPAVRIAEKEHG